MADRRGSTPMLAGWSMKQISLITLTFQNTALMLILYYSRIMPLVGGHRYIISTAVFLNEVLKLAVCSTIALFNISRRAAPSLPATSLFGSLASAVFTGDSWKLAIPASLYTLQNSLQYVAVSNLDAVTMQVTFQFKILPTALFSILLLRRTLNLQQWFALALLMLGVAIVQFPAATTPDVPGLPPATYNPRAHFHLPRSLDDLRSMMGANAQAPAEVPRLHRRSATYEGIEEDYLAEHPARNYALGVSAALLSCTAAALGSVYFERIIKDASNPVSIWTRNVQLSVYSLFPALFIGVFFIDGANVARNGFFVGYNGVVWTVIALQAAGGILVALCMHYADNIAKAFATSLSILLSLALSVVIFDFAMTQSFVIGTALVLFATYLYNSADNPAPNPALSLRSPVIRSDKDGFTHLHHGRHHSHGGDTSHESFYYSEKYSDSPRTPPLTMGNFAKHHSATSSAATAGLSSTPHATTIHGRPQTPTRSLGLGLGLSGASAGAAGTAGSGVKADRSGFAIKLPSASSTPLRDEALTTSRPGSPMLHHTRKGSSRQTYFEGKKE